ncbi:hypothetical protein ACFW95_43035 [Streptomyces sp. NPDC059474]|uniref:hypothetical protein n=1 Tax=Streptomyces sp. NPDC059474 TaxID=3346846 RepID=UPI0036CF729B
MQQRHGGACFASGDQRLALARLLDHRPRLRLVHALPNRRMGAVVTAILGGVCARAG